MGWAGMNGPLWSASAEDRATIQEPLHEPLFQAMMDAAEVGAGTRLLDIGYDGGCAGGLAVKRGAKVTGIDSALRSGCRASQRTTSPRRMRQSHAGPVDRV